MATITSLDFQISSGWDGAGIREARADIALLKADLDSLRNVRISVTLDQGDVKAQLDEMTRDRTVAIKVTADAATATADIDKAARDRAAAIKAAADTATAAAQLDQTAKDRAAAIKAAADTAAAVTELDQAAKDRDAAIKAAADTAAATAALDHAAADRNTAIKATADTAAAKAEIDVAARDRTMTIKVDADKASAAAAGGAAGTTFFGAFKSAFSGAGGIAALFGLGGLAGIPALAGLLAPVTGAIAAIGPAVLGAAATFPFLKDAMGEVTKAATTLETQTNAYNQGASQTATVMQAGNPLWQQQQTNLGAALSGTNALTSAQTGLISAQGRVNTAQGSLVTSGNSVVSAQAANSSASNTLAADQAKLAALQGSGKATAAQLAAAHLAVANAQNRVTSTAASLSSAQSRVGTAQQSASTAAQLLAAAHGKVSSAQQKTTSTAGQMNAAQQQVIGLLGQQNVDWTSLSTAQQDAAVQIRNNAGAYKALTQSQKNSLDALIAEKTAWDNLAPAQQQALKNYQAMHDAYDALRTAAMPSMFAAVAAAEKAVKDALEPLLPLIQGTAQGFQVLFQKLDAGIQSGAWSKFINDMSGHVQQDIIGIGTAIGGFAAGLGKLFDTLVTSGFGEQFLAWLDGVAKKFSAWAGSDAGRQAVLDFVATIKKDWPAVKGIVDDLFKAVSDLWKAFAGDPTALQGIKFILDFIAWFGGTAVGAFILKVTAIVLLFGRLAAAIKSLSIIDLFTAEEGGASIATGIWATTIGILDVVAAALGITILSLVGILALVVIGLAAIAFGIFELVTHWSTVWNWIKQIASDVWHWLEDNWKQLLAHITLGLSTLILFFVSHWRKIWEGFDTDVVQPIKNFFTNTLPNFFTQTIPQWFHTATQWFNTQVVQPISNFVTQTIPNFFTQAIPRWFASAVQWFNTSVVQPISNFVTQMIPNFFTTTIPRWFASAVQWFTTQVITPISNFVTQTIPNFFTTTIPRWFSIAVQWFTTQVINPLKNFITVTIPGFFTTTIPKWFSIAVQWFTTQVINPIKTFVTQTIPNFFTTTIPHWFETVVQFLTAQVITPIQTFITQTIPGFFTSTIPHWFDTFATEFNTAIIQPMTNFFTNTLPGVISGAIKAGLNLGIDVLNKLIGIVNSVTGIVGVPPIPSIPHLAEGGAVDGPGGPTEDKVPAMLSAGEHVWTAAEVDAAGGHGQVMQLRQQVMMQGHVNGTSRVPYATGGPVIPGLPGNIVHTIFQAAGAAGSGAAATPTAAAPGAAQPVAAPKKHTGILGTGIGPNIGPSIPGAGIIGGAIKAVLGALAPAFTAAINALIDPVLNGLGNSIPANATKFIAKSIINAVTTFLAAKDAAYKAAQAAAAAAAAATGGGGALPTGSLKATIDAALKAAGQPLTAANESGMLTLIMRESGGNPNAINTTDINALAGNPSQGLAQVIPTTFAAFHAAGTSSSITDPVANVAAAINYIIATYGSIQNVQQANASLPPKGYAMGTESALSGWHMVGENGPEPVKFRGGEQVKSFDDTIRALKGHDGDREDRRWQRFADHMRETMEEHGGGGDIHAPITINGAHDPQVVGQAVSDEIQRLRMYMGQGLGRRNH